MRLLTTAEALLPPEPWDDSVWTHWIAALERATGRVGNACCCHWRLALTGEDTGPDLAGLLAADWPVACGQSTPDRRHVEQRNC